MKTKLHSAFRIRLSALVGVVIIVLSAATGAPAQSGWGSALSFDGVDDYAQAGAVPLANSSFTLEAWARRNSATGLDFILGQGGAGSERSLHFGFHWGSSFVLGFYDDDLWSAPGYSDSDWHHWAATYNSTNKLRCLYRDGVLIATNTALTNYQGSGPVTIGTTPWGSGDEFDGAIDEVRIWGVARSQADIAAHMVQPLTGAEPNLLAYWRFDDGAGTNAADASPNGYNAVLRNGPSWASSTMPLYPASRFTAMSFDGANDYVRATIPALASNYTVSAWAFLRAGGNYSGTRMSVLGATNCGGSAELLIHSQTSSYTDPQYLELGRCGAFNGTNSTLTVPLNQWVHVAVTVSTNKQVSYFINGAAAGTWNGGALNLAIGPNISLGDNISRRFNGLLDEVQIWDRAQSQAEIQANLQHPLTGMEANLVAYYRFDEGGGVIARDASPNRRHGTLVNRPIRVPSDWTPVVTLNSPNPLTNECHVPFVDPTTVNSIPVAIEAGEAHSLALKADGTVTAWGWNYYGQTNVPASATNVVAIASSYSHSLALRANGTVLAWGANYSSQTNTPASATNIVAVAAGASHSLALRADGKVIGWGDNWYGQTNPPASVSNAVAVAAGGFHGLALRADGTVVAWGYTYYGQTNVPAAATNVVAVAAGRFHSLALRADGSVVGWGENYSGQANPPASVSNAVAIAAGDSHSLALRADGTVVGWGANWSGEVDVPAGATNVLAISAGYGDSLALRSDGAIVGWGNDWAGQATAPSGAYHLNLVPVVSGAVDANSPGGYTLSYSITNVLGHAAAATRKVIVADTLPPALALLGDNPLLLVVGSAFVDPGAVAPDLCMGNLTPDIQVSGTVNIQVPGTYYRTYSVTDYYGNTATVIRTVAVGFPLATTLPATDLVNDTATLHGTANPRGVATRAWFEWGTSTAYGNRTAPTGVGGGTNDVPLSEGLSGLIPGLPYHYRIVASNSVGVVRGRDQVFWLPAVTLNSPDPYYSEYHVPFIDPTTINGYPLAIAAGGLHSLALKADGKVVGWGDNSDGQASSPANLTNATAIAAGGMHNLALRADRAVVGWGSHWFDATNPPASATNVVAISAGYGHSLALRADGKVIGWGDEEFGLTNSPVSATNVAAIAAGYSHNLALRADGTVIAWGWNEFSQTNVPASAHNAVALAAGGGHNLALRPDGSVVAWGLGTTNAGAEFDYGQAIVPADATNVVGLAAGLFHSLALVADGTVIGWGAGTFVGGPDDDENSGQVIIPPSATNVVAIAAGFYHSLAMRSDGTVLGWGNNEYGQINVPAGLNVLEQPFTIFGTVNTNVLGTYVLTYRTTNSFGAVGTGTRTVVVCTRPMVTTEAVTGLSAGVVTLNGTANPRAAETLGWFEYGLGANYGSETPRVPLGNSTNTQSFGIQVGGLLPWMTYHYRAVASNGLGRTEGPDATFTVPGPTMAAPGLAALPDVTLPQGGSTAIPVAVSPATVEVRVRANNPVLLPEGAVVLSGSGLSRTLSLTPAPAHSGSAQVTVTATDGTRSASGTFTLTVTPAAEYRSPLLHLTDARVVSTQAWRFRIVDAGTGSTNYVVEYRSDLSPTNHWTAATNVTVLGGGVIQVATGPPQRNTGFYRVAGLQLLTAGFNAAEMTAEEGAAGSAAVLVFNGRYTGTVSYTWSDQQGTIWTDQVQVNGTTAVIPVPASWLSDNTSLGQLKCLTLQLDAGAGYALGATTASAVTIEENDANWQGTLQTPSGTLGLTLTVLETSSGLQGQIRSDGFGFFPTNALAQLTLGENAFTLAATNIRLPVLTAYPALRFTNSLDLRLDAANSPGQTNVSATQIQGTATLANKVPGRSYLDAEVAGTFVLRKLPTAAATNDVPLNAQ